MEQHVIKINQIVREIVCTSGWSDSHCRPIAVKSFGSFDAL